jgi:hypothetical protein
MIISIKTTHDNRTMSIERNEDDASLGLYDYINLMIALGFPTDKVEEQILIIAKNIEQKNAEKN